jgi:hypothetical protein
MSRSNRLEMNSQGRNALSKLLQRKILGNKAWDLL